MSTRVLHAGGRGGATHRHWAPLGAVAAGMLACACGTVQSQEPAPAVAAESNAVSVVPVTILEAAKADAAQRTPLPATSIKVVSAEAVTWPDGSLGCPQPGMVYTQALVPGFRIVLQAGEQVLNYHSSSRGKPLFCPAARVTAPLPNDRA